MEILSSSPNSKKVRVLVVDDSALMRQMLGDLLNRDPEIEVVGTAMDPYVAREKIKQLDPDVITLDINMPRMDGLAFLEKIMTLRPMPVVMISTLTEKGAKETLTALELGAVDYVTKPTSEIEVNFDNLAKEIQQKVKTAAKANIKGARTNKAASVSSTPLLAGANMPKLVGIGSSTGGVEALTEIFTKLPENCPPIVVVQHMPPKFTTSFAARLNKMCKPQVFEASHNQKLEKGCIYIAPGDHHLAIKQNAGGFSVELFDGENFSGHKPSVDLMFKSLANLKSKDFMGIILTGMGKDGAIGLKELRDTGSRTYGQNEESCLVYGMPKAAFEQGAILQEVHLKKMAQLIMGGA